MSNNVELDIQEVDLTNTVDSKKRKQMLRRPLLKRRSRC